MQLEPRLEQLDIIPFDVISSRLAAQDEENWRQILQLKPKLRNYKLFKNSFEAERYIILDVARSRRSYLAQLRMGILPLNIETGRYTNTPLEDRKCPFCPTDIESEYNFVFYCKF
jgi:hypothetical protein